MKAALLSLLGLAVVASLASAAPPVVTWLYPAGVQQGQSVEVTVGGSFERWPLEVQVQGQGLEVKPGKTRGTLQVTAAADAVPGIYSIRLASGKEVSAPRAFVVGTLSEIQEKEPNDDWKSPHRLNSSQLVVNGKLGKPGDVDVFALPLKKGQTLVASLQANRGLGSPMDAILQVLDGEGFVVEQNHDYWGLDPQITFRVPADGTYHVRLFAFPSMPDSGIRFFGAETCVYRLTLTTGAFAEYAWPLAVPQARPGEVGVVGWNIPSTLKIAVKAAQGQDQATVSHASLANTVSLRLEPHACVVEEPADPKKPQLLQFPVTLSGRLERPAERDVYRIAASKGQRLRIQVESHVLGLEMDPALRILDGAGKVVQEMDDTGGRRSESRDVDLNWTVPADGEYRLEVRDLHAGGGLRHAYRLRITLASGPRR